MMWCCLGRRVSAKAHVQDLIVDITKKVAHCEIAAKDGGRWFLILFLKGNFNITRSRLLYMMMKQSRLFTNALYRQTLRQ